MKINEDLILRYFADNVSEEEIQMLSEWLIESEANKDYFIKLKKFYIETQVSIYNDPSLSDKAFKKFLESIKAHQKQKITERLTRLRAIRDRVFRMTGIILLLCSVGTGAYFLGHTKVEKRDNKFSEIVVPYGGKSSVLLPDGSKVWLNAGSKIKYNRLFDISSREVFLEGEAYFNVQKKKYPFVVHTSHLDIQVLGTMFNVKSYPDEDNIETTLVEGTIRIRANKTEKPILLKPKEKLIYHKTNATSEVRPDQKNNKSKDIESKSGTGKITANIPSPKINIAENINTEESTSWKSGTLIFNKEPLETLAKKLERKFDIHFEFKSEKLKHYTYTGTLRDFPLEQVLKALKLTSPIMYSIDGKTVKLYFNYDFKPLPLSNNEKI